MNGSAENAKKTIFCNPMPAGEYEYITLAYTYYGSRDWPAEARAAQELVAEGWSIAWTDRADGSTFYVFRRAKKN
jgi:hypothetical protein